MTSNVEEDNVVNTDNFFTKCTLVSYFARLLQDMGRLGLTSTCMETFHFKSRTNPRHLMGPYHILLPLRFGWLLVLIPIRKIIYNFLNVCPFDHTAIAVSGNVERS